MQPVPLVVVDAANVVGSVPDGWWRDRVGATERLRDALAVLAEQGIPAGSAGVPDWAERPPLELVLVVEGAARSVGDTPGARVVAARGSGDDKIVEIVREEGPGRPTLVITADQALRRRIRELGAVVAGPRTIRPSPSGP